MKPKKLKATVLYHTEEQTWNYADEPGGEVRHHVYPTTVVTEKPDEWEGETQEDIFKRFYAANNRLRYCNGSYYRFKDGSMQNAYREWYASLSDGVKFSMFYRGGTVD